ncbi:MAG: hypothetical protein IJ784_06325, partial [Ruminiclostridium sp.]|nr:hypothetical protein [Ruminiclostridium sp.]
MKTKSIGKRLLAVLLTVCMMFSVITVGASAAVIVPTPSLADASYSSGQLTALVNLSNVTQDDMFELYMLTLSDPSNGMGTMTISGVLYYLLGIASTPVSDSTKVIVKAGKVQITDTMYWGQGSEPTSGTAYVGVTLVRNSEESEISNLKEINLGGGSTETWVKRYNATTHWDECAEGEQVGTKKNVEKHNFSTTVKPLSIEIPGEFNILYPLSEVNTPILSDTEGNKYSFSGCGFRSTVKQASGEATTRNYYFSNIEKPEGATDEFFVVNGYECTECGYFMFGEVGMGRIMQLEDEAFGVAVDAPVAMKGQRLTLQVMNSNPTKAFIPRVSTASGMPVSLFHIYRESIFPELDADEPVTELRVPSPSPEESVLTIDVYE